MRQQYETGNTIDENSSKFIQMIGMSQRRQMEKLTNSLDTTFINLTTAKVAERPTEKERWIKPLGKRTFRSSACLKSLKQVLEAKI